MKISMKTWFAAVSVMGAALFACGCAATDQADEETGVDEARFDTPVCSQLCHRECDAHDCHWVCHRFCPY